MSPLDCAASQRNTSPCDDGPANQAHWARPDRTRARRFAEPLWPSEDLRSYRRDRSSTKGDRGRDAAGIRNETEDNKDCMMVENSRKAENNERDAIDTRDRGKLHAVVDQTAETARQVGDKGADIAKRAVDTAADATRRTAEVATKVGEKIAGAVKGGADTAADATRRTAEIATDTAGRVADQGREATMSGLRAIAGVQGPLADA